MDLLQNVFVCLYPCNCCKILLEAERSPIEVFVSSKSHVEPLFHRTLPPVASCHKSMVKNYHSAILHNSDPFILFTPE